jgi:hypothetical protein
MVSKFLSSKSKKSELRKKKEEQEVHLFATTPWLQLNVILGPSLKNKISNQFTFDGVKIYKFKIQEK